MKPMRREKALAAYNVRLYAKQVKFLLVVLARLRGIVRDEHYRLLLSSQ